MFNLNLKKALELMLDNTTGLDSSRSHCGWGKKGKKSSLVDLFI